MAKTSADSGTHYSYATSTKVGNIGPTTTNKLSNVKLDKGSAINVGLSGADILGILNSVGPLTPSNYVPGGANVTPQLSAGGNVYPETADAPPAQPSLFSPMILIGIGLIVILFLRR